MKIADGKAYESTATYGFLYFYAAPCEKASVTEAPKRDIGRCYLRKG
jgi:hypothetical protein